MTGDRADLRFFLAVCLEAGICFAIPAFLLFLGIIYLPLFVLGLIMDPWTTSFWQSVALTVLGSCGLAGVVRVLILVGRGSGRDPRPWLTLTALACGVVAALLYAFEVWTHPTPTALVVSLAIVYLPLACAAHLVYLARRALFA